MSENQSDSDAIGASLVDPSAFGLIFERHYDAVHGYLQRRLDEHLADELSAQTFLVAFDGRSRFDRSRSDSRPWLFGIATNLAHNHRRREIVELRAITAMTPENGAGIDGIEARVDAERMRSLLAGALADLPTEESDVLCLLVWAELSQTETDAPAEIPGPGQFFYRKFRRLELQSWIPGGSLMGGGIMTRPGAFKALMPTTQEWWIAPDGAGRTREIAGTPRFLTNEEQSRWEAAGSRLPAPFDPEYQRKYPSIASAYDAFEVRRGMIDAEARDHRQGDPRGR
jgi:RNA polymerase sigma-70 factor (ECF subfamily)